MGMLIGKKGRNLIVITESYGLEKIWHNKITDELEFYGSYDKCYCAMNHVMDMLTWAVNIRLSQMDDEIIMEDCHIEFDYVNRLENENICQTMGDESQFPILT